ncbi:hypothetical protein [Kitasatospora sp. MAP5-34]|uniref:hypothetical protein n=1 Tax=Kitasatospora sp. MAP5-34 TaxID=3035102 RepID=UPI00247559EB|nr:hypothetical protein [Kitasatospora sp. MAP5-34]MDH6576953.1 N12 class adenine-specific DNA methylase [Kitasatospora sp. MAP5-34]
MRLAKHASSATPARAARPVTVEIERVIAPATFPNLRSATDALWTSLRALPLGSTQYEAYKLFFGPDVVERVSEFLDRDGHLHLCFALQGRPHSVWIRPTDETAR